MERISDKKLDKVNTMLSVPTADAVVKDWCSAATSSRPTWPTATAIPAALDPDLDPKIVGPSRHLHDRPSTTATANFRKTAAVMKMVSTATPAPAPSRWAVSTTTRRSLDRRDARLPRRRRASARASNTRRAREQPLMIYVFSDGSLSSNGMIDNSVGGRGKGVWTGDNQSTAAAFFLVFNPKRADSTAHQQPDRLLHGRRLGRHDLAARARTPSTCWSRRWCSTTWRCMARRAASRRCAGPPAYRPVSAAQVPMTH